LETSGLARPDATISFEIGPPVMGGLCASCSERFDVSSGPLSRRRFLGSLPAAAGAFAGFFAFRPARAHAAGRLPQTVHPDPREGVDASKVLTREQLEEVPDVIPLFDSIREIPHIVDGIHCYCGCASQPGFRSLLTCFESNGMAKFCPVCQGEGKLAVRRHAEGQSLGDIRRAIDARYGNGGQPHHHDGASS
jgi:hypothetical protein